MKGTFIVGYEINKKRKYKLKFKGGTHFGLYNCIFNKKSMFMYKCIEFIEGYSLRLQGWQTVEAKFFDLMNDFKQKLIIDYDHRIRKPMMLYKSKDLKYEEELIGDAANILALKNTGRQELETIEDELNFEEPEH